jgi:hypothetical protein
MDAIFEGESPRARLAVLLHHFSKSEDKWEAWRIVCPLNEVLLLVTCATIASCDDFDDIVAWGKHHLDFLRQFLVRANKTKGSIQTRPKRASCSPEFLLEILQLR